jgi:hypothetical protein
MNRAIPLAVVVTLVFAVSGCGGDGTTPTTTQETTGTTTTQTSTTETDTTSTEKTVTIVVEDSRPKGGIVRATVAKGDRVVLVVTSDVADEIHLHGYDLSRDVEAGGTARLPFTADVPGRFEVELEQRGVQIADLTVEP